VGGLRFFVLEQKAKKMVHISWSTYWTLLIILLAVYYGLIARRYYRPQGEPFSGLGPHQDPGLPAFSTGRPREEWMDNVLNSLEETILHAQARKYHPEELIQALKQKVQEQKQLLTTKESV